MSSGAADPCRRGIVFPQGDIGSDLESVRAYVRGVEDLGFDHLVVPDHLLGVDPAAHPGWSGPYDIDDSFHEPLVLFGFLSAISALDLVCGIIVLPQRSAAVVAKQAAEVDLLSGGRLRVGVGVGWNAPEFAAAGADFPSRAARMEEQIELLRLLWTSKRVDFQGDHHSMLGVGLAPLPVQRPIPIWIAAERATRAFERVGRLGDGLMAMGPPDETARRGLRTVREAASRAGRDVSTFGIEAHVSVGDGDLDRGRREIAGWRDLGATHLSVNTRARDRAGWRVHLDRAADAWDALETA